MISLITIANIRLLESVLSLLHGLYSVLVLQAQFYKMSAINIFPDEETEA